MGLLLSGLSIGAFVSQGAGLPWLSGRSIREPALTSRSSARWRLSPLCGGKSAIGPGECRPGRRPAGPRL